ncbi:MAG: helix-turn-helix domain-containing protein [Micromonosporaceae bacterium]|nr:helix-turn-helix domain-containing protein [Micromonosporaceae bacterium]
MNRGRGSEVDAGKVPAIERAALVLRRLSTDGAQTLSELVETLQLNKSTVYYLLQSMVAVGWVRFDEATRGYALGPELVELGLSATGQLDDLQVARRYLTELLSTIDATLVLYRRFDRYEVSILDKLERVGRVRITFQVGVHLPIQSGSFGRAFLAYDPPEVVDDVLARGLRSFTPKSETSVERFREQLAQTRAQGWAVDHEGYVLGVSTVSAPIFAGDELRLVAAAVSFTAGLGDAATRRYGDALRATCDRIGASLARA